MMAMIFEAASMEESLLNYLPTNISQVNKKRWHKAFELIYCSRALFSQFKSTISKLSPAPYGRVIIDVVESPPTFFKIDRSKLTKIVKDNKIDNLVEFGGVSRLAASLKSNLQNGISCDIEDISHRIEAFGAITYIKSPTESFFSFVLGYTNTYPHLIPKLQNN